MKNTIILEQFDLGRSDPLVLESLVDCYCATFAGPPWNETWAQEAVLEKIRKELNSVSLACIACDKGKVVGFAWGYRCDAYVLERKLEIPFADELIRRQSIPERDLQYFVFYQSELGVLPEYQGKGLGKKLFGMRLRMNMSSGDMTTVVRTRERPEPSLTYGWYRDRLGYRLIARYPESDGRVILYNDRLALLGSV